MARLKRKKIPTDPVQAHIDTLSHDGRGIASIDGKRVFISGAISHEDVTFKYTSQQRRYDEGRVLEVLKAAPERVVPRCVHFGVCGGCSMQHVELSAQLAFKQKALLEQLQHFGQVSAESILPPIAGNSYGYRGKARLGVRYVEKKQRVLVGFREQQSNYLADLKSCAVLHPSVGERIELLSQLVASLAAYKTIPQIEVAVGDKATALIFRHMEPLCETDLNKISAFAQTHGLEIYLQPDSTESIHKLWPTDSVATLSYALPAYQIEMLFHPSDFTQVNNEINQLMLKQALQLLEPQAEDTVLDLFCGLGNFTLPIARFAKHVVGVEGSQVMVRRAEANAIHNKISNVEFHMANLFADLEQNTPWLQQKFTKILLDPPRSGALEILPLLARFGAERIVYVSCNPATLARDAGELVNRHGYRLKQVGIINMFPHTSHIETMALFVKENS